MYIFTYNWLLKITKIGNLAAEKVRSSDFYHLYIVILTFLSTQKLEKNNFSFLLQPLDYTISVWRDIILPFDVANLRAQAMCSY